MVTLNFSLDATARVTSAYCKLVAIAVLGDRRFLEERANNLARSFCLLALI